jgi:hypothetical protein
VRKTTNIPLSKRVEMTMVPARMALARANVMSIFNANILLNMFTASSSVSYLNDNYTQYIKLVKLSA